MIERTWNIVSQNLQIVAIHFKIYILPHQGRFEQFTWASSLTQLKFSTRKKSKGSKGSKCYIDHVTHFVMNSLWKDGASTKGKYQDIHKYNKFHGAVEHGQTTFSSRKKRWKVSTSSNQSERSTANVEEGHMTEARIYPNLAFRELILKSTLETDPDQGVGTHPQINIRNWTRSRKSNSSSNRH